MIGVCKRCGYAGDISPARVCAACIERSLAEDPRSALHVARAAELLELVGAPGWATRLRQQAALVALFSFFGRCRK